ncbi:MAG: hydantoinase B/oxoprolinase family protein, partial [Candidatus Lokiarchaeota archaeon]|nr:hydantoinase B/oxoprolinase family protein [Candidatus Lokiarchaeota archaeon]MBD3339949.1 hydantoinase B/oxoprolinase family protein [Candidatus Lokiarchaeota archaeon]
MSEKIDPYLMIILPRMFDAITREMTFTLMKSGRSGVISTARDFSSAIVTADGRLFMIEEGLPIQIGTIHLAVQETLKFFDDLEPGDCIMNNCPYTGNTHHAEITILVPIFYEGEIVFWSISRAHQADMGAPIPTTYPFTASDIYQEGLYLPCIRCQRNYEDIQDIVRMVKFKMRVPDQWYGDYLAQIGSARIAERRVIELCEKYGVDTLKKFVEEWFDYSEKLMIEEIRKLKKANLEGESFHDPPIMFPNGPYSPPGITPAVADGIPVRAKVNIDPEDARITVDVRHNIENQPFGFNLCWSTTLAAIYAGIFNNINPNLPHNEGALRRITVLAEEGKIIGKPKFPASTGVSTTNIADRLINLIGNIFAQLGPPHGMADGNPGIPISAAVVSGYDWRKPDTPSHVNYIDQLIITGGSGGGGAIYGYDGYI